MTAPDQDFTATEPKTAEAEEATPWLLLLLVAALRLSRELASAAPAAAVVTASAICRDRAGVGRPQGRAKERASVRSGYGYERMKEGKAELHRTRA